MKAISECLLYKTYFYYSMCSMYVFNVCLAYTYNSIASSMLSGSVLFKVSGNARIRKAVAMAVPPYAINGNDGNTYTCENSNKIIGFEFSNIVLNRHYLACLLGYLKQSDVLLTNSGVSGAAIAPIRPIIEHRFIRKLRISVGHSSAV